jgi:hypothetical protein
MIEVFRDLFVVACLSLLIWGVVRPERIYQYPFFMGVMFVSFILPQAFALINNPYPVSQIALVRVLIVSCLCAVACWVGYRGQPKKKWLSRLKIPVDERRLFRAGVALMIQGCFFNFLLSRITIQTAANGNWTGPATILIFFAQTANIAFGIFFLQFLKRPRVITLACVMISSWPMMSAVLAGRRQPTITLLILVGLSFFWVRRYIPPRWLVIAGALSLTFIIPVVGLLRGYFWTLVFSGDWQALLSLVQSQFGLLQEGEFLELRNAALVMDAVDQTGLYGFGAGWWDSIIFQYVPGQIVGFGVKESLQFNLWDKYIVLLWELYRYSNPNGFTFTGIADSFTEFGYFGFLSFSLIGCIFKHLWVSATYQHSTFSKLLYIGLASPSMLAVSHGTGLFIQQGIFQVFFVTLVIYYARVKPKVKHSPQRFRTKRFIRR